MGVGDSQSPAHMEGRVPKFMDKAVVARVLEIGAYALQQALHMESRAALADYLAPQLGLQPDTIAEWFERGKARESLEDGVFYALVWIVLRETFLGVDWLRFLLSETTDHMPPDAAPAEAKQRCKMLLQKARFGADRDPIVEGEIAQVVERLYPEPASTADMHIAEPVNDGATRLPGSGRRAPVSKQPIRWWWAVAGAVVVLALAVVLSANLAKRGCHTRPSEIVQEPKPMLTFERYVLLGNFYEDPYYISFGGQPVGSGQVNLEVDQSLFGRWRFGVSNEFISEHPNWTERDLWRVDALCKLPLWRILLVE